MIRGTDFDNVRYGGVLRAPRRYITQASHDKRVLREGDLVVENSVNASSRCVGTPLLITQGVLRRTGDDAIAASFCKVFRPRVASLAPILYLWQRCLYEDGRMAFYQHVATNGIGNFQSTRFIESEHVPLPQDDDQLRRFERQFADLTGSSLADRIYLLRQTRDLLLPRLISGELDVSDLDIDAGELGA